MLDKAHAEKILRAAVMLDHNLGALDDLVSDIDDPSEKAKYVDALGDIVGLIAKTMIFPIMAQYPDLDDTPEPMPRP